MFYGATPELLLKGFTTVMTAKADWESMPIVEKIQMFLKIISDQMADIYILQGRLERQVIKKVIDQY